MPNLHWYDAAGALKTASGIYFYDAAGVRKTVTEGYFYNNLGELKRFYPNVQPDVLNWTMTPATVSTVSGYVQGTQGSLDRLVYLNNGELLRQSYDSGTGLLTFSYGGVQPSRAAFDKIVMTLGGTPTNFYSSAARYASGVWQWAHPAALTGSVPSALTVATPTQNSMTAALSGSATGYSQSVPYGSMAFGGPASQINGLVINGMFDLDTITDYFAITVASAASPGQNHFTSLTVNGKTYLTANATRYRSTTAGIWRWEFDNNKANFVAGNTYPFTWT